MLVALALLGLIVAAIVPALGLVRSTAHSIEQRAETPSHASIESLLRQLLEQARPPRVAQPGETRRTITFIGTRDSVSFVSGFAPRGMRSGIYKYKLALEQSPSNPEVRALILRYAQLSASELTDHKSHSGRITLADNVASLALQYFGFHKEAPMSLSWRPDWQDRQTLPNLIAIEIRCDRQADAWTPVVVASQF